MKRFLQGRLGAALFFSIVMLIACPLVIAQLGEAVWAVPMVGLLVNKESIAAAFVNLKTTFNKAFAGASPQWTQTAMRVPSTGKSNLYAWVDLFPRMRKWVGDKVVKSLKAHGFTIENDDYEATVEVDRNDIEDDSLGNYAVQAQDAGTSAAQWPDEMVADVKNAAFTSLCYDGQYFYDTDHPVEDGAGNITSVSNRSAVALSCASKAAAAASYGAARAAIMSFKDDEGRPLGLVPDVLEVPPALEATAKTLLEEDKLDDNSPNPYRGTAKVLVNPRLTSTTAWMLHVTARAVKPYVFQERKAPVFVQQTSSENDDVFMRKKFKFGAEARGAAGFALWQLSFGSTGV